MGLEQTPKTFNARFEKEVFWAIADLLGAKYGRDKTEVVKRAILEAKERLGDDGPIRIPVTPLSPVVNGRVMWDAAAGREPVEEWPFHPQCRHCPETFGSRVRFATLCPDCKRANHGGDPRECPVCTAGQAI